MTSESPGCLGIVQAPGSPHRCLLDMGRTLAMIVIDCMLGGQANLDQHALDNVRPYTDVELNLLKKACLSVVSGLINGLVSSEGLIAGQIFSNPAALAESGSNDAVALISYEIACGAFQGLLQLCIPWKLAAHETLPQGHQSLDSLEALRAKAGPLPVRATARIAQFKLPAHELASLQPGDIVMTDVSRDDEIQLAINGHAVFHGTPGQNRNRKAIVLTKPLHQSPKAPLAGETDAENGGQ